MNQSKTINISHSLAGLFHWFYERNDFEKAEQMLDLLKKEKNQGISVGFSGHYSAGKSSLINYFLDKNILPSSPIPTSANIVEIHKGEDLVKLVQQNGELIQVNGPANLEDVQEYCKDGELVKRIILTTEDIKLPLGVTLIDTPGIDSAKDADAILTESTLHTIDVLFYVVDYNHVQSEHNLYFLQQLQRRRKPFYLIVHQIDKHQEREGTFEAYQGKISQVLNQWSIEPKGIFYTSLYNESHPHNQLKMVLKTMEEWERGKMDLSNSTIQHSIRFILQEYIDEQRMEWEEQKESLLGQRKTLIKSIENLKKEPSIISPDLAEAEMRQLVKQIGQRAQITPYELREQARSFLTVMQPEYKSGLFFSKRKTEQERIETTDQFHQNLIKIVEANLQWPIRQKVSQFAQQIGVTNPDVLSSLEGISIHFPQERLKEIMKPGAKATGDYLLLYMEDVKQDLIKAFTKEVQTVWEKVNSFLDENYQEYKETISQIESYQEDLEQLENKLEHGEQEWERVQKDLRDLELGEIQDSTIVETAMQRLYSETFTTLESFPIEKISKTNNTINEHKVESKYKPTKHNLKSKNEILEILDSTIPEINRIESASIIKRTLLEKKKSLETNEYTIALFGAFSAGKSSFINALIGKNLMPVSAHPTTATITRVLPPPSLEYNQKVEITVKTAKDLADEMMDAFDLPSFSVENFEKEIKKLKKKVNSPNLVHWLDSLLSGYQKMVESLGETLTVSLNEMESFIKDEERASYIEKVDIYDENPLTRAGIILVDTPGADSVHSRHTRLSFQFIKDSDAIIYVSYYNHSFAKADASFLYQLGRIQDAFHHDKMFFVVNAVDLAKSENELQLVLNYVKNELSKFDIQEPRLYPVSSKIAIEATENSSNEQKSGVSIVKKELFSFIDHEIDQIMVQQAEKELKYTVQWLDSRIKDLSLNHEEREKKIEERKLSLQNMKMSILDFSDKRYSELNDQKLNQQLFHIQKRMILRSMDLFKEVINPATIKANGKQGKNQLINQLHSFFHSTKNELIQDLTATTLRIEYFMKEYLNQWKTDLITNTSDINTFFHRRNIDCNIPTPNLSLVNFVELEKEIQSLAGGFKNTKEFFEEQQVVRVKDETEKLLHIILEKELTIQTEVLLSYYQEHWKKIVAKERNQLKIEVEEIIAQENQAFTSLENIKELREIKDQIKKWIN